MASLLFPLQFERQYSGPLDFDQVFTTTASRIAYITNPLRYAGQIVSDTELNKCYQLNSTKDEWIEIGGTSAWITFVQSNSANWNSVTVNDPLKYKFTGDGATKQYAVSGTNNSFNPSYIEVFVENVRQEPNTSYTLSADIVKFVQAPENDSEIVIITPNTKLYNLVTNESNIPYFDNSLKIDGVEAPGILSNLATKVHVDDAVSPLATKIYVDTEIAQINQYINDNITDLSNFTTKEYVSLEIAATAPNLTQYATKEYTDTAVSNNSYRGTDIKDLTGNWQSTYIAVCSLSAEWASAYLNTLVIGPAVTTLESSITTIQDVLVATKSEAETATTLLNTNSAKWETVYSTFLSASGSWEYQGTDIKSLTSNWETTYQTVSTNSTNWSLAYSKVNSLNITDISSLYETLTGKQPIGNYPVLDVNSKIPSTYLPGAVDEIQEYTDYVTLTAAGNGASSILYLTLDDNKVYRWGNTKYVEIVGSPGSTDSIIEGEINKYFTVGRAAAAAPVQSVAGRNGAVNLNVDDISGLTLALTANNTLTTSFQVKSVSQGVYTDGSVIPAGTPLETIIKNMLTTLVYPVYSVPLLTVTYGSPAIATVWETGNTVPGFTTTPTYTPRDGGTLTSYVYLKNNTVLGTGNSYLTNSFQINGTTTLQVSASYGAGPIKNDNLGNPYGVTSIKAGSLVNTITLNTLYPYFYGRTSTQPTALTIAQAISSGSATKVLADASGTVSITYNANAEYIWLAHYSSQTTKTKWYFTDFNSNYIGPNGFINAPVLQGVTSPESYWTGIQYKVYISRGQTTTSGVLQYRNS